MYESFYNLREKPFTLLPDPGFLFLSDKHRMALTLLEYGLMNQAGFTVISGDIGTGKTTLIRHLLDHMDREHTVGLISNTHREFGELLQWILLAFNLDHAGMNKVESWSVSANCATPCSVRTWCSLPSAFRSTITCSRSRKTRSQAISGTAWRWPAAVRSCSMPLPARRYTASAAVSRG
jgi:hypothetical protein